jgi:hypothetical protein
VTSQPFESYARNGEDVVLWRALGNTRHGRFLEILSQPVSEYSMTRALAERGWQGHTLDRSEADRAAAALEGAGWSGQPLPLLVADDLAAATAALMALRPVAEPTVVVVAGGVVAGGVADHLPEFDSYQVAQFNGVSTFLIHANAAAELGADLAYPACSRDEFTTLDERRLAAERDALATQLQTAAADVVRWRAAALHRWNAAAAGADPGWAHRELEAMRNTVSWRVTRPLRAVRRRLPASRIGG